MPNKDAFAERERALEDQYFQQREQELIEKMRRRAALDAERQQLAEVTGTTDQEILQELQQLGYTRETVVLLHLLPLVQVAWAERGVSEGERQLILDIAKLRGVEPGSAAYEQLIRWLETRPTEEFAEKTLRLISAMLQSLPSEKRDAAKRDLIAYCTQIAAVSGGMLGFTKKISDDERALIEHIAAELERGNKAAAQQIINTQVSPKSSE